MASVRSVYVHILSVTALFAVTFSIVVPLVSFYLPFAKLYGVFRTSDEMKKRAEELNNQRLSIANNYFQHLNAEKSLQFYKSNREKPNFSNSVIVVVVTVARKKGNKDLGYFLQTTAALDRILKEDNSFAKKELLICDVDVQTHKGSIFVSQFIPTIHKFSNASYADIAGNDHRKNLYLQSKFSSRYEKESIDYLFCLETAFSKNYSFVVMVEDDAYPKKDFLDVAKFTIDRKINHFNRSFVYLKMFYPPKWQGFAFETTRILDVVAIGCVGAGIFVSPYLCSYWKQLRKSLLYFYFISGAIYFILLALLISRPNVMELRRLSHQFYAFRPSPGCCTPAMLYSNQEIPGVLSYLSGPEVPISLLHTDLALSKYIRTSGKPAYQLEPNLFHHLGLHTSLSGGAKNPEEFIFYV